MAYEYECYWEHPVKAYEYEWHTEYQWYMEYQWHMSMSDTGSTLSKYVCYIAVFINIPFY